MELDTVDTATFIKTINDSNFTKKDYDLIKKQVDAKIKKYNEDMIIIGYKLNELNDERDLLITKLQKIYLQSKIITEIKKDDENLEVINNIEEVILKKPSKNKKEKPTKDEIQQIKNTDNNNIVISKETITISENLNVKNEVKEEPIKKTKNKKEKNIESAPETKTIVTDENVKTEEQIITKNITETEEKITKNEEPPIKQTKTKKEKKTIDVIETIPNPKKKNVKI